MNWEVFTGNPRVKRCPTVSVHQSGKLRLNRLAVEALRHPKAVRILFAWEPDSEASGGTRLMVRLDPVGTADEFAFPLMAEASGGGYQLGSSQEFSRANLISPSQVLDAHLAAEDFIALLAGPFRTVAAVEYEVP